MAVRTGVWEARNRLFGGNHSDSTGLVDLVRALSVLIEQVKKIQNVRPSEDNLQVIQSLVTCDLAIKSVQALEQTSKLSKQVDDVAQDHLEKSSAASSLVTK